MKKTRRRLSLDTQTIKNLTSDDLAHAAGGNAVPKDPPRPSVYQCPSSYCSDFPSYCISCYCPATSSIMC